MGATLRILRESEDARAERENASDDRKTRSKLFNLSDVQVKTQLYKVTNNNCCVVALLFLLLRC